jgi:hypothetical protein
LQALFVVLLVPVLVALCALHPFGSTALCCPLPEVEGVTPLDQDQGSRQYTTFWINLGEGPVAVHDAEQRFKERLVLIWLFHPFNGYAVGSTLKEAELDAKRSH